MIIRFFIGGGFEGDMILPDGYDPTKDYDGRGDAAYGPRQWPNNIVPYDLTLITTRIFFGNRGVRLDLAVL